MWDYDDRIAEMENTDSGTYPKKCPVCGKDSIHMLMHRPKSGSSTGGFWIWCSFCKKYSHASVAIPRWWRNFNGLEESQLYASPEFSMDENRIEIDRWVNQLIRDKVDGLEESPKTAEEDRTFYVIRIDPQRGQSEEQADLLALICRCEKEEAMKRIEREGFVLHPMPAVDIRIVKKELESRGIKFSITPEYNWS